MSLTVIIEDEGLEPTTIDAGVLSPGDIVYGRIGAVKRPLLITYNSVVDLQTPTKTWTPRKGIDIVVDYFMEGTLTLKRKAA